jgi:hypothetical protein
VWRFGEMERWSIAKSPGSGIMYAALMDDPTRGLIGSQPPDEPQNVKPGPDDGSAPDSERSPAPDSTRPRPNEGAASRDPKFIGDAMRSLYRSSATSIERGDATRVIGRTDSTRPIPSTPPPPSKHPTSSSPPGPRVDVMLWLVLALGLFAIAGVMLSGAL